MCPQAVDVRKTSRKWRLLPPYLRSLEEREGLKGGYPVRRARDAQGVEWIL